MTPELRGTRLPGPPDGDAVLAGRIRDEIAAVGPVTFARFMALALYDPERGYYRATGAGPGREGDFLTAPETHPVFGRALGRALGRMWQILGRPDTFTLREYGAGSGALALGILGGLRADGSGLLDAIRYDPVEIDDRRAGGVRDRLAAAGFDGIPLSSPQDESGPMVGCIVANEFLDALPVHRVIVLEGRLREVFVDWRPDVRPGPGPAPGMDGAFVELAGPPSTPALADRLAREGIVLVEGQRAEVCLALDDWVADVSRRLGRGFVLVVDYGHPAADLYGPLRREGTLRTYARHAVGADPYVRVGRQDMTAHVDLTALTDAAEREDLQVLGVTTQAEFLVGAGLPAIVEASRLDPATTLADQLALRASLERLLDPRAMGGFAVVVLGRGLPADARLEALDFRLRR